MKISFSIEFLFKFCVQNTPYTRKSWLLFSDHTKFTLKADTSFLVQTYPFSKLQIPYDPHATFTLFTSADSKKYTYGGVRESFMVTISQNARKSSLCSVSGTVTIKIKLIFSLLEARKFILLTLITYHPPLTIIFFINISVFSKQVDLKYTTLDLERKQHLYQFPQKKSCSRVNSVQFEYTASTLKYRGNYYLIW